MGAGGHRRAKDGERLRNKVKLTDVRQGRKGSRLTAIDHPTGEQVKQPDRPRLADVLGPGLITGASDDDPSGIATYSQAGAQFGYGLIWSLLFTYPVMCAIQMISADIGRVTGKGLAANMRTH